MVAPATAPYPDSSAASNRAAAPVGLRGVTARAVIIGLLLIPLNCYWVIAAELRWYVVLTLNPLFVTPVFYLFVLSAANRVLQRRAPRWALSRAELITIYILLVLSCTVATHDFLINLMSTMGWARWYATPANGWETSIFPHLPKWLLVWDIDLLSGAFKGNSSLYRWDVVRMWATPLLFWFLFIAVIGWTSLCLNVIIRRAWIDNTRLSFPIVRLPLAITEPDSPKSIMRSRALWSGFAFAAALGAMNGFHEWFPALPGFQVRAQPIIFPTAPLNTTWPLFLSLYPFGVGLAFLVPLDVSFSCWFFYLFAKAQSVVGYQLGYGDTPDFPFVTEQAIGAWLAFGIFLVYNMRGYLSGVFRAVFSGGPTEDSAEPLPYRLAVWGMIGGLACFCGFWWVAGMSLHWALLVTALYFLLALCITRVRAEAGGQHTVWDLEPMRVFRLFDSRTVGPANMAAAAMSHWYWRLNRSHPMPSQLESFKQAQEHRIRLRSLALPMMAAFALATVAGMWACLHVFYAEGAAAKCQGFATWTGTEEFGFLQTGLGSGFKVEGYRWASVGAAAAFVGLLALLRTRFAWFPFHPLGYCIGPGLIWLWFPFFLAWFAKLLILRYGGMRMYRVAMPFFLGLVLGDYVEGAVWSLIGVTANVPVYQIFH